MDKISKISSVLLNILNLAAGIGTAVIMILNKPFAVVVALPSLPRYAQLFVNLMMFQIGIVLLMVVISNLINKPVDEFKYPVIYLILPIIVGIIGIYFGIISTVVIEKVVVIVGSIVYVALSGVLLYFSSKLIEGFAKEK